MMDYDVYVSILCTITYVMLTTVSVICTAVITYLSIKLIRSGAIDDEIIEEYGKSWDFFELKNFFRHAGYVFSSIVFCAFVIIFICSQIVQPAGEFRPSDLPSVRVVQTGSMAKKHEKNTYLEKNDLNNQIQTFDLIVTKKLPDEMDLKLYDIVVYEAEGLLIVHRIVDIEEPNEQHPDCRYFKLQGDANESPDRFTVRYDQIKAIYTGIRVPFLGSFVVFMQSPVGWLCIILVIVAMVLAPLLEKWIEREKEKRLEIYYFHRDR